jgi:hypothetical protein
MFVKGAGFLFPARFAAAAEAVDPNRSWEKQLGK